MTTSWRIRDSAACPRWRRDGFSLIELLTVIAVIAILAGILIPVSGMVRRSAAESKTRSQFAQYATAYQSFKADYGFYPSMGESDAEFGLRGRNAVFVQTLAGRTIEGEPATESYARQANRRLIRYYTFATSDLNEDGEIVDAFDNPNIFVVIDRDQDGVIRAGDFEELPAGDRPQSLPGAVYFYSSNREGNPDWEWIYSWE